MKFVKQIIFKIKNNWKELSRFYYLKRIQIKSHFILNNKISDIKI